jgi:hypothetical protein
MTLKFFFNRQGKFFFLVTILGLSLMGWQLFFLPQKWISHGLLTDLLLISFLFLCFLFFVCRFIPWYPSLKKGQGIEQHFEKMIVPTSYLMVLVGSFLSFFNSPWIVLFLSCLILFVLLVINFILIYLYLKDTDKTSPGYFSILS